ncbi:hypothetical protein H6P81_007368 [Aristolochia fimbriata]|uniref:Retrovirus-related Pol polyprotein from transposon TNT 1-94-like beta-barrel domain-containing protein n=1 Tax=Aristolochia fimbriata TaxID=158543 RepID=A0AAV7F1B0_ARIFI|nr:hypothetical protein H6P81_007368 [Aristolochia fimbriata]
MKRQCPKRLKSLKKKGIDVDQASVASDLEKRGDVMSISSACNTVGMGIIKIKMFNGIVRTLANVRYVPELKKNLISLGALDSSGCSFNTTGGIMKVKKGRMVVMKGKKKVGNLYHLIGNTITGGAAVTSCDDKDEATFL